MLKNRECYEKEALIPTFPLSVLQNEFCFLLISSCINFSPLAAGIRLIMTGWKWLVPPLFANHPWQMRDRDTQEENFPMALKRNDVCHRVVSINISYCLQTHEG